MTPVWQFPGRLFQEEELRKARELGNFFESFIYHHLRVFGAVNDSTCATVQLADTSWSRGGFCLDMVVRYWQLR